MPAQYPSHSRLSSFTVAILTVFLNFVCMAQDQAPAAPPNQKQDSTPHRPRIGLALSGGGALGLAQIGVLRWLDENHVPIDRIAGTSMGSIIGVMYATGMSPQEIEKFAES